jgi:transposase
MATARTLAGLDVHAAKIVAAVLDVESGELRSFRLPGDVTKAARFCSGLARPVRATYEAGPTGYGLARELERRGIDCLVSAACAASTHCRRSRAGHRGGLGLT